MARRLSLLTNNTTIADVFDKLKRQNSFRSLSGQTTPVGICHAPTPAPPVRTHMGHQQLSAKHDLTVIWEQMGNLPETRFYWRFNSPPDRAMFHMLKAIALVDACWVSFMSAFGCEMQLFETAKTEPYHSVPIAESVMAFLYFSGILWRFVTSDVDLTTGAEYVGFRDIAKRQVRSLIFWTDLFSIAGNFWWIFASDGWEACIMAPRMLRIWRLPAAAGWTLQISSGKTGSAYFQMLEICASVWFMAHFFACSWFVAATWEFDTLADLQHYNPNYFAQSDFLGIYVQCLRDGAAMTIGWTGPPPVALTGILTMPERVYWIIYGPFAALYMAWIFARFMVFIERIDREHTKHTNRMDGIQTVLRKLGVPQGLTSRVMQYHAFLSVHNIDKSSYEGLFKALTPSLAADVKLCVFENLVMTAPFFQAAPVEVVRSMVTAFEEDVFSPGDFVVSKGAVGNEMFFVIKGTVEVLVDDAALHCVAERNMGEYFGEIALVYANQVRTAWIKAKTFCVCATLVRTVFDATLEEFPEVRQMMIDQIAGAAKPVDPPPPKSSDNLLKMEMSNHMLPGHNSARGGKDAEEMDLRDEIKALEQRQRMMQEKLFGIKDVLGQLVSGLGLSVYDKTPAATTIYAGPAEILSKDSGSDLIDLRSN